MHLYICISVVYIYTYIYIYIYQGFVCTFGNEMDDAAVNDPVQLKKNLAEYREQLQEVRCFRCFLNKVRLLIVNISLYMNVGRGATIGGPQ